MNQSYLTTVQGSCSHLANREKGGQQREVREVREDVNLPEGQLDESQGGASLLLSGGEGGWGLRLGRIGESQSKTESRPRKQWGRCKRRLRVVREQHGASLVRKPRTQKSRRMFGPGKGDTTLCASSALGRLTNLARLDREHNDRGPTALRGAGNFWESISPKKRMSEGRKWVSARKCLIPNWFGICAATSLKPLECDACGATNGHCERQSGAIGPKTSFLLPKDINALEFKSVKIQIVQMWSNGNTESDCLETSEVLQMQMHHPASRYAVSGTMATRFCISKKPNESNRINAQCTDTKFFQWKIRYEHERMTFLISPTNKHPFFYC